MSAQPIDVKSQSARKKRESGTHTDADSLRAFRLIERHSDFARDRISIQEDRQRLHGRRAARHDQAQPRLPLAVVQREHMLGLRPSRRGTRIGWSCCSGGRRCCGFVARVRVAWELRCTRICGLFLSVRSHSDAGIYRRTYSLMSPYLRACDNASEPDAWITIKEIKEQLEPGTLPSPAAGRDLSTKHPISRIQSGAA